VFRLISRLFRKVTQKFVKPPAAPAKDLTGTEIADAWMRQMEEATGDQGRAAQASGWALMLRSPFRSFEGATSWIGGTPVAPAEFKWPRGREGQPLQLLAQIDLAALKPNPDTGSRPLALPETGAMLVFAGLKDHAVRVLTAADMAAAKPVPVPADMPRLRDIGHWSDMTSFGFWPVDPVPFLDDGAHQPAVFPLPSEDPCDWIMTWGIAQLEADLILSAIARDQRDMADRVKHAKDPMNKVQAANAKHLAALTGPDFQELVETLKAWRDRAASADPAGPVDRVALQDLMAIRRGLAQPLDNRNVRLLLLGRRSAVWEDIRRVYRSEIEAQTFDAIPAAFRPFIEADVMRWRGHRAFGLLKDLWHNSEDRRGQDLVLSLSSDDLLRTGSDHNFGLSVWCDRGGMAKGQYDRGQLLRHDAG
jgi:hypothetical protein